MSWIQKTINEPRRVDVVACDGCGAEAQDPDDTWSKLSIQRGETTFHFCATCRPALLTLLRNGLSAASDPLKERATRG